MASTIDRTIPVTNAPLESLPVRNNFGAAADDIEELQTDKADQSALNAHTGASNPHSGSASQTDLTNHTGAANPHSGSAPTPVTATHLANNAVIESKIANNAVTTNKISNDDVTNTKLANMAANTVKARTATSGDPTDMTEAAATDLGLYATGDGLFGWKAGGALGRFTSIPSGGSSPLTTKGDVYTRDASADARLPVGANGTTLTANSATATGLEWTTPAGGGDVTGPASAVNGNLASFNGTTGKVIQDASLVSTNVVTATSALTDSQMVEGDTPTKGVKSTGFTSSNVVRKDVTNILASGQTQDALDYTGTNPAIDLDDRNHIRLTNASPGTPTIAGGNGSLHGLVTNASATLTLTNFTVRGTIPAGANKEFTIRRFGTGAANNIWRWLAS